MVRTNPALFDDQHEHFRDRIMKFLTWQNIAAAIDIPGNFDLFRFNISLIIFFICL